MEITVGVFELLMGKLTALHNAWTHGVKGGSTNG